MFTERVVENNYAERLDKKWNNEYGILFYSIDAPFPYIEGK